jgi:tripartite-type tricarboxylate transporter receptor subunit TctC
MKMLVLLFALLVSAVQIARAQDLHSQDLHSQDYPSQPVRIVVTASPGGITDTAARIIGQGLTPLWGQSPVVENKPGGGGTIATTYVSRATPDGYTLLAATNGEIALAPVINPNISYDPKKDLTPIVMATINPIILVASGASPFKTVKDLIDAAKDKPGTIAWASPGVGTWNHLAGEWFQSEAGIKLIHVPYKGGGPAAVALAAGDVQVGIVSISSAQPFLDGGKIRVLAVMTKNRAKFDPSWPTLAEAGVPHVDATNWVALFGPANVSDKISQKISADTRRVLQDPNVQKTLDAIGVEPADMSTNELIKQIDVDRALSERIARQAKIAVP